MVREPKLGRFHRIGAVLICLALLYFAAGGSFLHQHQGGHETVCHVCHSLHAPALSTAFSGIASAPQVSGWYTSQPVIASALDDFSILHQGRAPPSA